MINNKSYTLPTPPYAKLMKIKNLTKFYFFQRLYEIKSGGIKK